MFIMILLKISNDWNFENIPDLLSSILFFKELCKFIQTLMDHKPLNLHIIQSVGGLWDSEINKDLPHSKVFSNESDMLQAGYIDGSLTDIPAIEGAVKIGLIYHGTKSVSKVEKFLV